MYNEYNMKKPTVIAIGVFDGVHKGHQALLKALTGLAQRRRAKSVALTFGDHPEDVLSGGPKVPFLLPRTETFHLLKHHGACEVRLIPFTRVFARKTPAQFIQWLQGRFKIVGIVVGNDFRFGKGAQGNVAYLRSEGSRLGFEVLAVSPVKRKGKVVSSSRIRDLLMAGRIKDANDLLGRPYELDGVVVHGKHVGHHIGFPTANLGQIPQVLPRDGVYACIVPIGGKKYRAAMNLGRRPTFKDDDHHRTAEVHLLGYKGEELYGKPMRVWLMDYLRPERKFLSIAALARQIKSDIGRVMGINIQ
jgi:riboflavin kinase / FMN adenylyltransferase